MNLNITSISLKPALFNNSKLPLLVKGSIEPTRDIDLP